MTKSEQAARAARDAIRLALQPLSDEDYLAALDDIIDTLEAERQAKVNEMPE